MLRSLNGRKYSPRGRGIETWTGETREGRGPFHPSWVLMGFFVALIAVGTLLLSLPGAVAGGGRASFMDALFTATSAATGTGLVVQDTAVFWSLFGQKVVLALLLVGGLGALVGSTILLLLIARRVSTQEKSVLRGFLGFESAGGMAVLILGIVLYALLVQLAGAYLLTSRLVASVSQDQVWWLGVFHAVSAFNNAGFEILGMGQKPPDTSVQLVLAGLSLIGSLSFIIFVDLIRGAFRHQLALDTKLVLAGSVLLLGAGMAAILLTEARNPQTLGPLSLPDKLVSALFHSASARTTGLATVNLAAFAYPTLLIVIALMFIGGASGSTSGGIKVNTFALLGAITWSFIRGRRNGEVMGTPVQQEQVYRALAVSFLSVLLIFAITLALSATESPSLLSQLFETVSAFSTTGFSLGITSGLSQVGKLLIIFTMFAGRVGPVTLAFALSLRLRPSYDTYAEEAINLG